MLAFGSVMLEVLLSLVFIRILRGSSVKENPLPCMQKSVAIRYLSYSNIWSRESCVEITPSGKNHGKSGLELCNTGAAKILADAEYKAQNANKYAKTANFFISASLS